MFEGVGVYNSLWVLDFATFLTLPPNCTATLCPSPPRALCQAPQGLFSRQHCSHSILVGSALGGEGALIGTQIPAVLDSSPLSSHHTSKIQLGRIVYINHEIGVNIDIKGGSRSGQKNVGKFEDLIHIRVCNP